MIKPLGSALAVSMAVFACRETSAASAQPEPPPQRIQANTARVVARAVPRIVPVTGTLDAELRTELTANAAGRVTQTFVERGQQVERGAVVARLDVRAAAATVEEAKAQVARTRGQLEAAELECSRAAALAASGAISQAEHDRQSAQCNEVRFALAVAQAHLASKKLVVDAGAIRAPFAGVVTQRFVSVGDYVQPSSRVVSLVASHRLRLEFAVSERHIGQVQAGALVTFSPLSIPGHEFTGRVEHLSGEVRKSTRDMVVEATVPNGDGLLLPGMFVEVNLHTGERTMPVIPRSAVFAAEGSSSVYVLENGRLELRTVMPGAMLGADVAIEEGVTSGEVIVTHPLPSMFDGAPVE